MATPHFTRKISAVCLALFVIDRHCWGFLLYFTPPQLFQKIDDSLQNFLLMDWQLLAADTYSGTATPNTKQADRTIAVNLMGTSIDRNAHSKPGATHTI